MFPSLDRVAGTHKHTSCHAGLARSGKTGIQYALRERGKHRDYWIPAFAGMTRREAAAKGNPHLHPPRRPGLKAGVTAEGGVELHVPDRSRHTAGAARSVGQGSPGIDKK